ncbi:hypothetical protein GCM10029964_059960 [Kibdelosporangium lantanae]
MLSALSGTDQRTDRVLTALHRRFTVEQAKGVIMASCRTDPLMAWLLLQDTCRRSGTTLQALAGELVRQVRDEPDPAPTAGRSPLPAAPPGSCGPRCGTSTRPPPDECPHPLPRTRLA